MSGDIVIDGGALAEYLVGSATGEAVATLIAGRDPLHAPHLVVPETLAVLRKWSLGEYLDETRLDIARHDLARMPMQLWEAGPFADRVWALRHNITAYDATYIALAEAMDAALVTSDARLAAASGPACPIMLAT